MKHFNYYFIIIALAFTGLTSCSDDDPIEPAPEAPTVSVTVSPEATEYFPGTELTFTIVAAPATNSKLVKLEVDPNPNGQFDSGLNSHFYNTAETVTYKYIVPKNTDNVSIAFMVSATNSDNSLFSSTTETVVFAVKPYFIEYNNIKLYNYSSTDITLKSLIRWDTGDNYSIQETIDGDTNVKLGVDMYPIFTNFNGTDYFFLAVPSTVSSLFNYLPSYWGDPTVERQWASDKPIIFSPSNLDFDDPDLLPSDITGVPGNFIVNPIVGAVYAIDNAMKGIAVDGTQHPRNVNDVVGLMKIEEINWGTQADFSDAYTVVSLKVANK